MDILQIFISLIVKEIEKFYPRNHQGRILYGDILKRENIELVEMPEYQKDNSLGQYIEIGPRQKPVIYINPLLNDKEKRYVIIYELANYFLYKQSTTRQKGDFIFSNDKSENTIFAHEFLLPNKLLRKDIKNFLTIKEISEKYRTPEIIIQRRINNIIKI